MSDDGRATNPLLRSLAEGGLLRGPFAFVDYWANVLGLEGVSPDDEARARLIHDPTFRLGIDRPDLDIPRLRTYLLPLLAGPFLFLMRSFRRLGKYASRFAADPPAAVRALDAFRLELRPTADGAVDAIAPDGRRLAAGLVDPFRVGAYCSLFWAVNKIPLAALASTVLVLVATPLAARADLLPLALRLWVPLGFPLVALGLWALYREWTTALLGAMPVLIGRILVAAFQSNAGLPWANLAVALGAMMAFYVAADWFFVPRPVPPALLLYTRAGPAAPYARERDAPYWLEGEAYWVWRYLLLSPAEINKFWERDWERVEIWVRADGPSAGELEWVVTDLHYRELWFPLEGLARKAVRERDVSVARDAVASGASGVWLVEVDADVLFHYPAIQGVTFLPDTGTVPVRGLGHLLRALRERRNDPAARTGRARLEALRLNHGVHVLGDLPELIAPMTADRLLSLPWRYWRYPLGAASRRQPRLYGRLPDPAPPEAADRALQIKSPD
ncbi:MAG: hypothetical protein ABFS34_03985 [Gemmatimonadota bacterium]